MEVIRLGLTKCEANTGPKWPGWGQGAKIDAGMRTPIWGGRIRVGLGSTVVIHNKRFTDAAHREERPPRKALQWMQTVCVCLQGNKEWGGVRATARYAWFKDTTER